MTELTPTSSYEPIPASPFLEFLLAQPAIQAANPEETDIFMDLDETMFRRDRGHHGQGTGDQLIGSWRPDILVAVQGLRHEGFRLNILSSATTDYIQAALQIFEQQFAEDPKDLFNKLLSSRDYDHFEEVFYGFKSEVVPLVAQEITASEKRHAIFVDDDPLDIQLEGVPGFDIVIVPRNMRYRIDDAPTYGAPLPPRI